jgi:hypothetical protein
MADIYLKSLEPGLVHDALQFVQNSLIKILESKIGIFALFVLLMVARYSYAQESRTQNRVTIFTRRSRKLINKMKELPK